MEDEGREIAEELEVSNSKEEKKKQATLRKEKRKARAAARLSASCLRESSAAGPVSGLSAPSPVPVPGLSAPSASAPSAVPVPGTSAPSASAGSAVPVPSSSASSVSAGSAVPVSDLSAPSASAGSAMSVPGSSTLSASALSASAPSTSAPFAFSGFAVPMPGLSASATPVFGSSAFSTLVVTPTPGRQKLIELNQREKRATSEELAPAFTPLLPSEPPLLFPASCVGEKRSFDKAFDINCRLLANNQFGEDVDPSFVSCQCSSVVKANRPWQQELLNPKTVCIVEAIPLAAAILWDPNFLLCPKHTLKLAKKLELKMKNLKAEIVKERIGQIWANRIIVELDLLFKNNPDWWRSTAVIFAQPTAQQSVKNVKKN